MKTIYDILKELNIPYEKHDHPAVFTVEEAEKYDRDIPGGKSKNLFLRNKKGDIHYLVVAESTRKIDLKQLSSQLFAGNLSFASPERLLKYLDLTPGSVSPFGLINDTSKSVKVVIDNGLLKHEKVGFHPNVNTSTLVIKSDDLKKFLEWTGNNVVYI
jgi:Ala-tRNA(Pro) deacylase